MNFTEALNQAQLDVRKEAAARKVKTTADPDNWINYFPHLHQDYSYCYLTLSSSQGSPGVEEAEKALAENIEKSDKAWGVLDRKARRGDEEMEFTPWEMMTIAANDRTDAPNCMRAAWKDMTDAQEDYHNFFITESGKPCYEGKKEFETLYRTYGFISSLAKALREQS